MSKLKAFAAAVLGMGAMVQTIPAQNIQKGENAIVQTVKDENRKKTIKQSREIKLNPIGGIDIDYTPWYNDGRSPKQYGQYLQFFRLQKWTKSKK